MIVAVGDDAVSEAIGFVLIFGLMLTGIGLVTFCGYPMLTAGQNRIAAKCMEQTMIGIQSDMESLCFRGAQYRESALLVNGGTLEVVSAEERASPKFMISCDSSDKIIEFSPGALIYRSDRGADVIALENGAVIMHQEGSAGSVMLAAPGWFCDVDPIGNRKTFVIYLMEIVSEPTINSGMTTLRMKLLQDSSSTTSIPDPGSITVTYRDLSDEYSAAWRDYLTGPALGMSEAEGSCRGYTMPDVDRLVVKEYVIEILGI